MNESRAFVRGFLRNITLALGFKFMAVMISQEFAKLTLHFYRIRELYLANMNAVEGWWPLSLGIKHNA